MTAAQRDDCEDSRRNVLGAEVTDARFSEMLTWFGDELANADRDAAERAIVDGDAT